MIKGIVFDMDGVLIDAREWHKDALNKALNLFGFEISEELHREVFDGLPTRVKLEQLTQNFGFPRGLHGIVSAVKQELTMRIAAQSCYPNPSHIVAISFLRNNGYTIACATNSVRQTSEKMLEYAGVLTELDILLTNEDVKNPKPDPEIYSACSRLLNLDPEELLVIEDNKNGVRAAKAAGCHVLKVDSPDDVNLENLLRAISENEDK